MKKNRIIAAITAALFIGGTFQTAVLSVHAANHVSCITVETDEFTKPESFTQFGIIYDIYKDHAAVRSLAADYRDKTEKFDIVIPDTIKNVPVTEINGTAIYGTKVENVTFGRNIKTIGSYAFEGCTELRSIELIGPLPLIVSNPSLSSVHVKFSPQVPLLGIITSGTVVVEVVVEVIAVVVVPLVVVVMTVVVATEEGISSVAVRTVSVFGTDVDVTAFAVLAVMIEVSIADDTISDKIFLKFILITPL